MIILQKLQDLGHNISKRVITYDKCNIIIFKYNIKFIHL